MSKYIDVGKQLVRLYRLGLSCEDVVKQFLLTAPAADVVEVVRCKDCKHYNAGFECLIEGYGIERDKDWYCGDAERGEKE